jgi:hypothetical protein
MRGRGGDPQRVEYCRSEFPKRRGFLGGYGNRFFEVIYRRTIGSRPFGVPPYLGHPMDALVRDAIYEVLHTVYPLLDQCLEVRSAVNVRAAKNAAACRLHRLTIAAEPDIVSARATQRFHHGLAQVGVREPPHRVLYAGEGTAAWRGEASRLHHLAHEGFVASS